MSIRRSFLFAVPLFALMVACGDDVVDEETMEPVEVEVEVESAPTSKKENEKKDKVSIVLVPTTIVIQDVTKSTEYADDWQTLK